MGMTKHSWWPVTIDQPKEAMIWIESTLSSLLDINGMYLGTLLFDSSLSSTVSSFASGYLC